MGLEEAGEPEGIAVSEANSNSEKSPQVLLQVRVENGSPSGIDLSISSAGDGRDHAVLEKQQWAQRRQCTLAAIS